MGLLFCFQMHAPVPQRLLQQSYVASPTRMASPAGAQMARKGRIHRPVSLSWPMLRADFSAAPPLLVKLAAQTPSVLSKEVDTSLWLPGERAAHEDLLEMAERMQEIECAYSHTKNLPRNDHTIGHTLNKPPHAGFQRTVWGEMGALAALPVAVLRQRLRRPPPKLARIPELDGAVRG